MALCQLIDYSERPASTIELYKYSSVSPDDIAEIRETISPYQLEQLGNWGFLTVNIVDNRIDGIKGLLTIWHDKSMASIDTGNGNVWGNWDLHKQLVLTAMIEETEDIDGKPVRGRIAYNSHGIRGIYSGGIFYTLCEPVLDFDLIEYHHMIRSYMA